MISGFSMDEPRIKVKVSEIRCETGNVKTFKLILAEGEIVFTPGQFVMLYAKIDGEEVGRAYSIASSPLDKGSIELTIELTPDGRLTPFFHKKVEVGDEFEISQPKGHFTYTEEMGNEIVLIAGGSGVVPFMSIMKYCTQKKLDTKITLLYSAKTVDRIIYREELNRLADENRNITVLYTITRQTEGWDGRAGRIDRQLLEGNFSPKKLFYICGPIPFIRDIGATLKELGADRQNIKRDVWGA